MRFIKVSPPLTISDVDTRTLRAKHEGEGDPTSCFRRVFRASEGRKGVDFQFEDELEATSKPGAHAEAQTLCPLRWQLGQPWTLPPPTPTAGPAISIEDIPICAVSDLTAIVSVAEEATQ